MYHFLVQRKYVNLVLILRLYFCFLVLKHCIPPVDGYRLYVRWEEVSSLQNRCH